VIAQVRVHNSLLLLFFMSADDSVERHVPDWESKEVDLGLFVPDWIDFVWECRKKRRGPTSKNTADTSVRG